MRMQRKLLWAAIGGTAVAMAAWLFLPPGPRGIARSAPHAAVTPAPDAAFHPTLETAHYAIVSHADDAQTKQVADVVEALHRGFLELFPDVPSRRTDGHKLQLVLYRDRAHFRANNHSKPWAEAYYLPPTCYAYYAVGERNPYHWMQHEATHQLHTELAGFSRAKWLNEGLASYLGASRIESGTLMPGTADANAYPIWWLSSLYLSGNFDEDVAQGRVIPLRALIEGTGPPIGQHVNLYYIEYWSLTHFLLHHDNGHHAKAYRTLLEGDGSLAEFEAEVGPVEQVQAQWYAYLRSQAEATR